MGASTLLLAVAASLRGIMALTTNGEFVLFSQNPIQFISFFILFYMMLANGFGMLVLSKEQTDLRLQEVLKEQKAILDTLPTGLCILRDRVIVAVQSGHGSHVRVCPRHPAGSIGALPVRE